ncbi:MAG: YfhO family protein, partial [Thermoanaerobaculia bacterium]
AALTSVAGVFLLSRAPAERATAAGLGLCLALLALADSADLGGAAAGLAAVFAAAHLVSATLPLGRSVSLSTLLSRPLPSRGKVLTSQDEILSEWASAALPDEAGRVRRQVDSLSGYTNLLFGVSKARTAGALPDLSQQIFMQSLTSLRNFLPVASISGCGEIRFPRGPKMARVLVPEPFAGATFFFEDRTDRDSLAALAAISSGAVDFRRVLTLASPSRLGTGRAGAGKDIALASRLTNTPEKIIYSVTLSRGAWLYLPMSWDRWWRASIDGRSAPIEKANGVFSAVLVPEGQHRLVWAYRPWPFYAGAALSGAGLLVLAAGLLSGEPPLRARASGTRGQ